jgi:hypothetical protein
MKHGGSEKIPYFAKNQCSPLLGNRNGSGIAQSV